MMLDWQERLVLVVMKSPAASSSRPAEEAA